MTNRMCHSLSDVLCFQRTCQCLAKGRPISQGLMVCPCRFVAIEQEQHVHVTGVFGKRSWLIATGKLLMSYSLMYQG